MIRTAALILAAGKGTRMHSDTAKQFLTVGGKPLKDYRDAEGHFRAISLVRQLLTVPDLTEEHLFALHKLVVPESEVDIYKPRGAWKTDYNGTYIFDESGKSTWVTYPAPAEIPTQRLLMRKIREPVALTAARASLPSMLPTISASAVL